MFILICEISDFELVDQGRDDCFIRQNRRHDNHRACLGRNLFRQIDLGKQPRLERVRDVPVQHVDREVAGRNQSEERADDRDPNRGIPLQHGKHEQEQKECGQDRKGAEIHDAAAPFDRAQDVFADPGTITNFGFQPGQAVADEVVTDMRARVIFILSVRSLSHFQRSLCDFQLALFRAFADSFNDVSIAIAGREIHARIDCGWIFRQLRIDAADLFKKVFPIECRKQPHARDDVAHSHLGGSLAMMLFMDNLFERQSFFDELLVERFHHRHDGRVLIAQALNQLHDKGALWPLAPLREQ